MKLKLIFSLISLITANYKLSSQNCKVDGKIDWKLVELRTSESQNSQDQYVVIGEWVLKRKSPIDNISDLSNIEKRKLKKKAAKNSSCLVFIRTKALYENRKGIYYYWVKT